MTQSMIYGDTHIVMHPVFFLSDIAWYMIILSVLSLPIFCRNNRHLRQSFRQVIRHPAGLITLIIICFYLLITTLDSIHFKNEKITNHSVISVLDIMLAPVAFNDEVSYSKPFAKHLLNRQRVIKNNQVISVAIPLRHTSPNIQSKQAMKANIAYKTLLGAFQGILASTLLFSMCFLKKESRQNFKKNQTTWQIAYLTFTTLCILIAASLQLIKGYHILGTDQVGHDVFYLAIKSIRTGVLIGTLTTLFMLPLALIFGLSAGYFGGLTDDVIQYIYTTLSSIPGILLISASILALQIYIHNHPQLFSTMSSRSDARLLALCMVLGLSGWCGLCRLLRAETLKLKSQDFILASRSMGSSMYFIFTRHLLPNVFPIVLISIVLDFSGLVLAEAVLAYVGIGVDPTTPSWGNMINGARLEMARQPMVWWPLLAAFIFMFILVLSVNLFSDQLRDAFDPHTSEIS